MLRGAPNKHLALNRRSRTKHASLLFRGNLAYWMRRSLTYMQSLA